MDKLEKYKTGINNIIVIKNQLDNLDDDLKKRLACIDQDIKKLSDLLDASVTSLQIITEKLDSNYI